jgi:hypothetical protein
VAVGDQVGIVFSDSVWTGDGGAVSFAGDDIEAVVPFNVITGLGATVSLCDSIVALPNASEGLGAAVTLFNSNVAFVGCADAALVGDKDDNVPFGGRECEETGDPDIESATARVGEEDNEPLVPEDIDGDKVIAADVVAADGCEVRADVDASNVDVADASAVPAIVGWLVETLATDADVGELEANASVLAEGVIVELLSVSFVNVSTSSISSSITLSSKIYSDPSLT